MITKEELEKAHKIIKQHKIEQSCCSKCGKSISTRWEENACHIKLEIGIDCCSTEALFGEDFRKIGFNHPAIKEGSGYQKVLIESHQETDYRLCWSCHRQFVKRIGDFLKNDLQH
jgi:ribosomal protein L37AE/L43A